MAMYRVGFLCLAFGALTAFAPPNASGIYLLTTPSEVDLVQLVQSGDGKVTGRLEITNIKSDGTTNDRSVAVDGAASQRDLMFKPASVWTGGLEGSGTFSDSSLTVVLSGTTLNFKRSSLPAYQAAISHLQSTAASVRQAKATNEAQTKAAHMTIDTAAKINSMTAALRADTAKITAGVANSPDFAARAEANSNRIERMMQAAPSLSGVNRSQLIVQANQVEVDTNQIEVARSQYAIELNQPVNDGEPIADRLGAFCGSADGARFARECAPAKIAISDFRSSISNGQKRFSPHKQALQHEIQKQTDMIQRMGS